MTSVLPTARLVVVTGKGGVGKTTVAAALGLVAAREGRRTVVCEVGGQGRLPGMFGLPAPKPGREIALCDGLDAISVDATVGLGEWLARLLPSQGAALLMRSGTFGALAAAAPGISELVSIVKAWELGSEPRWDKRREPYDCVVLDAPASGHGLAMLRTPRTFADIARVGPIGTQSALVADDLQDPERTAYVAVALPTELAVTETLELEARLDDELGAELHAVVCNGMLARRFDRPHAEQVMAVDGRAGRAVHAATGRVRAQHSQLERLRRHARAPVTTLPFRFTPALEREDLEALSQRLTAARLSPRAAAA